MHMQGFSRISPLALNFIWLESMCAIPTNSLFIISLGATIIKNLIKEFLKCALQSRSGKYIIRELLMELQLINMLPLEPLKLINVLAYKKKL